MKRLKIRHFVFVALAAVQSVTAFAKNEIPQEFQEQCAQYVAVRYTDVYVKSRAKTKDSRDVQKYLNKFPNVDSWTLSNTEDFKRYFSWFADTANHFSATNQKLLKSIQPTQNIDNLLVIDKNFNNVCKSIQPKLREDILQFVDENTNNNSMIFSNLVWLAVALVVFAIVWVILFFINRNRFRNYIIQTVCHSGRVEEKFGRNNADNNFPDYQGKIAQLERQIAELKDRLQRLENKTETPKYSSNPEPQRVVNEPQKSAPEPQQSEQIVYVRNYQLHSGKLKVLEDSSSAEYKIILSKGGNGKFEFCGNVQEALLNSDAVFDTEICDLKGKLPATANRVQTTEKGEAVFDGKFWKVTKPIVITLS